MKLGEITVFHAVVYKRLPKVTIKTLVNCSNDFIVDPLSAFSR